MAKKKANILQIIQYGLARLRLKTVDDEYLAWLKFANAGMMTEGNYYLFDLAIKNLPTNDPIIEIGSFCGLSTNIMNYFLRKYNKPNIIITSDKWVFETDEPKQTIGNGISMEDYSKFVKDCFIRNIKMFSYYNLPYAIEEFSDDFFKLWEQEAEVTDVLGRKIKLGGKISMAFIDGNHSYDFVKRDFENTDKYLVPGGFILFDDSADYYDFGSAKFMKEMKKNKRYRLVAKNPNYLFQKVAE